MMTKLTPETLAELSKNILAERSTIENLQTTIAAFHNPKPEDDTEEMHSSLLEEIDVLMEKFALVSEPFKIALSEALTDKLSQVFATKTADHDSDVRTYSPFCSFWKEIKRDGWAGVPEYVRVDTLEALTDSLVTHLTNSELPDHNPEEFAALVSTFIDTGTLPCMIGNSEYFKNFADGSVLYFEMENWQLTLSSKDQDGNRTGPLFLPPSQAFHQSVEFPTGQLLAAAGIHIGNFDDLHQNLVNKNMLDLNYTFHRILHTALCTSEIGLVTVSVGDSGPNIIKDTNTGALYAAHANEAAKNLEEVAVICNDYWSTTIVDRKIVLDHLVAGGMSEDKANAEIDAWLGMSKFHSQIDVAPGTWNLFWDDDRKSVSALVSAYTDVNIEDTHFLLTQVDPDFPEGSFTSVG